MLCRAIARSQVCVAAFRDYRKSRFRLNPLPRGGIERTDNKAFACGGGLDLGRAGFQDLYGAVSHVDAGCL